MAETSYLLALGSNKRHGAYGAPAATVDAALGTLRQAGVRIDRVSMVRHTPALGPAGRSFANAAAAVTTALAPPALLERLQEVEKAFGRRGGRRWGPRVLDLDIILWSEGWWADGALTVPHPEFRKRRFVLEPLAEIAPTWRDPLTGATLRQLLQRTLRASPVDRRTGRS